MKENQNRVSDDHATEESAVSNLTGQLPEWHPFAVWKSQIQQDQTTTTGQHRILHSVKVADV